jgi:hypothetical protein
LGKALADLEIDKKHEPIVISNAPIGMLGI